MNKKKLARLTSLCLTVILIVTCLFTVLTACDEKTSNAPDNDSSNIGDGNQPGGDQPGDGNQPGGGNQRGDGNQPGEDTDPEKPSLQFEAQLFGAMKKLMKMSVEGSDGQRLEIYSLDKDFCEMAFGFYADGIKSILLSVHCINQERYTESFTDIAVFVMESEESATQALPELQAVANEHNYPFEDIVNVYKDGIYIIMEAKKDTFARLKDASLCEASQAAWKFIQKSISSELKQNFPYQVAMINMSDPQTISTFHSDAIQSMHSEINSSYVYTRNSENIETYMEDFNANKDKYTDDSFATLSDGELYAHHQYKPGFVFKLNDDNQSYSLIYYGKTDDRITELSIPSSYNDKPVTAIGDGVFVEYSNLEKITIPDSILVIGDRAFYNTGLKSLILSNNLTSIGVSAFEKCDNLENVIVGNNVNTIRDNAFYDCGSLKSITLPNSLTNIGSSIISNCTNLKTVDFKGTVAQWLTIYEKWGWNDWSDKSDELVVHCTDGDVNKRGDEINKDEPSEPTEPIEDKFAIYEKILAYTATMAQNLEDNQTAVFELFLSNEFQNDPDYINTITKLGLNSDEINLLGNGIFATADANANFLESYIIYIFKTDAMAQTFADAYMVAQSSLPQNEQATILQYGNILVLGYQDISEQLSSADFQNEKLKNDFKQVVPKLTEAHEDAEYDSEIIFVFFNDGSYTTQIA